MEEVRSSSTPLSTTPTTLRRFSYWPLRSADSELPSSTTAVSPTSSGRRCRYAVPALLGCAVLLLIAIVTPILVYQHHPCPTSSTSAFCHPPAPIESSGVRDWRTPVSDSVATVAVNRTDGWWLERTDDISRNVQQYGPTAELILIGDSITQKFELEAGADIWRDVMVKQYGAVNLGISGDSTQHVIWRLQNGNLPDNVFNATLLKCVIVLIGTNNAADSASAGEIANGTARILQQVHQVLPAATVILLSIFPRETWSYYQTIEQTNNQTMHFSDNSSIVQWVDFRQPWLEQPWSNVEQQLGEVHSVANSVPVNYTLMPDGLHPSADGYQLWVNRLQPLIDDILGARGSSQQGSNQYQQLR